jgi:hypothetical protein
MIRFFTPWSSLFPEWLKIVPMLSALDRCRERELLLREYSDATREYSGRIRALTALMAPEKHMEYMLALRLATQSHALAEYARLSYERHVSEHGC